MKKKYFFLFLLAIFILLLRNNFCSAIELEVDYPTLATGEKIIPSSTLPEYFKYIFNFAISIGFLAVFASFIYAGFLYVASAGKPEMIQKAKERIFSAISGMLLLLTSYLIITTIDPNLQIFKTAIIKQLPGLFLVGDGQRKPLTLMGVANVEDIMRPKSKINYTHIEFSCAQPNSYVLTAFFYEKTYYRNLVSKIDLNCNTTIPVQGKSFNFLYKDPGVYLYKPSNCSATKEPPHYAISNISDLGELQNKINSAAIVHKDPNYFIAILYELVNFRGRCYYVHPNIPCDNLNNPAYGPTFGPIASSVSVYRYDHNPEGGGVIFYRKASFNDAGGSKKINDSQIKGIYMGNLEELEFDNVPIEEQDCIEWNLEGICTKREPPNLAEKNISSIKIDGNYLVLFVSFDFRTNEWAACQAFPALDDTNKEGPEQIKWEYLLYPGRSPNYVFIFPIKEK